MLASVASCVWLVIFCRGSFGKSHRQPVLPFWLFHFLVISLVHQYILHGLYLNLPKLDSTQRRLLERDSAICSCVQVQFYVAVVYSTSGFDYVLYHHGDVWTVLVLFVFDNNVNIDAEGEVQVSNTNRINSRTSYYSCVVDGLYNLFYACMRWNITIKWQWTTIIIR